MWRQGVHSAEIFATPHIIVIIIYTNISRNNVAKTCRSQYRCRRLGARASEKPWPGFAQVAAHSVRRS